MLAKLPAGISFEILEAIGKAWTRIGNANKILCSVSGGADSDLVVDMVTRCDPTHKTTYMFFDTGLEYQATKEHLKYLEDRYDIIIEQKRPAKPIPIACRDYGLPFLNKQIAEYINRLQRHGFAWEDKPLDELLAKYPKCKVALRWWCNDFGENSRFNISATRGLKEYMMCFPPAFTISNKCCEYAKKSIVHTELKTGQYDLDIMGIRKSEGGVRSTVYNSCFMPKQIEDVDLFMPIFWFDEGLKQEYCDKFQIQHSRCYTEYGLKRTGCAGCPFGKDHEKELKIIKVHEPKLEKACRTIFGDSYDYSNNFKQFRKELR